MCVCVRECLCAAPGGCRRCCPWERWSAASPRQQLHTWACQRACLWLRAARVSGPADERGPLLHLSEQLGKLSPGTCCRRWAALCVCGCSWVSTRQSPLSGTATRKAPYLALSACAACLLNRPVLPSPPGGPVWTCSSFLQAVLLSRASHCGQRWALPFTPLLALCRRRHRHDRAWRHPARPAGAADWQQPPAPGSH